MCRHWWICGETTWEGNVMVTQARCKLCPATKEHRLEYKVDNFALGTKPRSERLEVWR